MRKPFHSWWQHQLRHPWEKFFTGAMAIALCVLALMHDRWDTFRYLDLAGGSFFLCTAIAAWAYRRRHPLPPPRPGESALEDALG